MSEPDRLKLLIAESKDFAPQAAALLRSKFDVRLADLDRRGLLDQVAEADLLWVRLRHFIDGEILDRAKKLKAIITNTTGLNHIDLESAERRGVRVISLRGEVDFLRQVRGTAELTIGLTLALLRKIPRAHADVCAGRWDRSPFRGREIFQKTVGIIGYGRLGSMVADYFRALGASIVVTDPKLEPGSKVDSFAVVSLAELMAMSDIVSLHASYQPSNKHLLDRAMLSRLQPSAVLINTARGELIDETALVELLREGRIAGAALDVVESEHALGATFAALREMASTTDRVLLTPHIGGNTVESTTRSEEFLACKLCDMWAQSDATSRTEVARRSP